MSTAAAAPPKPSSSAGTLKLLRKVHLYVGVFIAPALLFFAFTGAVQTLGLHEGAADYKAPALLVSLGQLHKKQTYLLPTHREPAPGARAPEASNPTSPSSPADATPRAANTTPTLARPPATGARTQPTLAAKQKQHLPLKVFFLLVSLGLLLSTLSGIYMAYKYDCNKLLITALLVLGAVLPPILASF